MSVTSIEHFTDVSFSRRRRPTTQWSQPLSAGQNVAIFSGCTGLTRCAPFVGGGSPRPFGGNPLLPNPVCNAILPAVDT